MMRIMSPLLTEEEPGLKRTNGVGNHMEVTLPDKEVTNSDQDQKEEEI